MNIKHKYRLVMGTINTMQAIDWLITRCIDLGIFNAVL